jgi:hypothetical protein
MASLVLQRLNKILVWKHNKVMKWRVNKFEKMIPNLKRPLDKFDFNLGL